MRRVRALVSLVLLALLLAEPVSAASAALRLGLLAVKEEGNGFQGVVIHADLVLGPGNGTVRLLPEGMVDESTAASTMLGFMLSTALAGKDYRTMGLRLSFETNTPVGGPSASGFIAASILLLSLGLAPNTSGDTMTGMLSPTGLVLSVAGVSAKVEAAEKAGYRKVLVPAIEDSKALSKIAPGLRVRPVCSIIDAAEELAGTNLTLTTSPPVRPPVPHVFIRDTMRFINYSEKLIPLLDNTTRSRVEHLISEAKRIVNQSPYSAASLAFTALLRAANYTANTRGFQGLEKALGVTLKEALKEAEEAIDGANYTVGNGLCDSWRFAATAAAAYRLYLARHVSSEDTGFAKALALLRALSARTWAEAANELHGPLVPCSFIADASAMTLSYARASLSYLTSVVNKRTIRIFVSLIDNRTMSDWLRDAEQAQQTGNYPLATGLAVYIISEIEFRLDTGNTPLNCLSHYWARLAAAAGPSFLVPSSYYHEYAARFEKTGPGKDRAATSDIVTAFSLETAALAWLLPGVFLHAVAQAGSRTAIAASSGATGLGGLPYAVIVAEGILLAAVGASAARLATLRRHEV